MARFSKGKFKMVAKTIQKPDKNIQFLNGTTQPTKMSGTIQIVPFY